MHRILIIDDDVAVTNYLMVFLTQTERFESTVVNDSREVAGLLANQPFDLLLLDMDMPNVSGLDILKILHGREERPPVIVLTGVSDVELAVRAMKMGAFDYLTKPVDDDHLLSVIDSALEHRALQNSIEQLPSDLRREDLTHRDAFEQIPTQNPEMIRLLHQAERLAMSELCIFISGERGTGKENLARAIHGASRVGQKALVVVDASAQAPDQFPASFFGQAAVWSGERKERPGFLEEAEGGTIYLCEIEHLTLPMQVRLKRVLQTGEYYRENSTEIRKCNVRFIVSSSHELSSEAYQGTFSRDLLYHLMVNSLHVPPLRKRLEDLPLLTEHFRELGLPRVRKEITGFTSEFVALLGQYDFPDNVQELRNIIEGSMVNADGPVVGVEALPSYIRQKIAARKVAVDDDFRPRPLAEVQREHVLRTLRHFGGDRDRAARELGIAPDQLDAIETG